MKGKGIFKVVMVLFWLCVWQVAGMLLSNPILFATPVQTGRAFVQNMRNADFWRVAGMSLLRIGSGFFLGLTCAVALASFSYRLPLLEELFRPVADLIKTVPVVCFAVLLLIWQGPTRLSVAVGFLMVFSSVYFSTLEGLKAVCREKLEMAKVFGLSFGAKFFYLYRPALKPYLMGSMQTGIGMAFKSGVAAEVIGLPAFSIGEKLYLSKISLDTAGIFAWTAVVCILSFGFEKGILFLAARFFAAEVPCRAPRYRSEEPKEIRAEHLKKSYGEQKVLDDYSLQVAGGETRWFTQPSGSGKTTLFRILIGLDKQDEGEISAGASEGFDVLFQEDRLCEEFSPLLNVTLVTGSRAAAREILEELLEPRLLEKPCRELSGGEKRRVALARALAARGGCLILDEPFAGLDQENIRRCLSVIEKRKAGRTLLIADHVKAGRSDEEQLDENAQIKNTE